MNKRNIAKLEKLVEILKTTNNCDAYRIVENDIPCLLYDIGCSLVANDFKISHYGDEVVSLIAQHKQIEHTCHISQLGICMEFYNKNNRAKRIELAMRYFHPGRISLLVIMCKKQDDPEDIIFPCYGVKKLSCFTELLSITSKMSNMLAQLDGFIEDEPGVFVRQFSNIQDMSQLQEQVLPVWHETLGVLKSLSTWKQSSSSSYIADYSPYMRRKLNDLEKQK